MPEINFDRSLMNLIENTFSQMKFSLPSSFGVTLDEFRENLYYSLSLNPYKEQYLDQDYLKIYLIKLEKKLLLISQHDSDHVLGSVDIRAT